jgi:hypothetical protein
MWDLYHSRNMVIEEQHTMSATGAIEGILGKRITE